MTTRFETNGQDGFTNGGIREGMMVVDASNLPVGVVTASFLHSDTATLGGDPSTPSSEEMDGVSNGSNGNQLIPTIAGNFLNGEKIPEILFVRLQRTGFLRVERSGVTTRTFYVTPDQIQRVSRNRVKLAVLREMLLSY